MPSSERGERDRTLEFRVSVHDQLGEEGHLAEVRRQLTLQVVLAQVERGDARVRVCRHAVPGPDCCVGSPVLVVRPLGAERPHVEVHERRAVRTLHRDGGHRRGWPRRGAQARVPLLQARHEPGRVDRRGRGVAARPRDRGVGDRLRPIIEDRRLHADRIALNDRDLGRLQRHPCGHGRRRRRRRWSGRRARSVVPATREDGQHQSPGGSRTSTGGGCRDARGTRKGARVLHDGSASSLARKQRPQHAAGS